HSAAASRTHAHPRGIATAIHGAEESTRRGDPRRRFFGFRLRRFRRRTWIFSAQAARLRARRRALQKVPHAHQAHRDLRSKLALLSELPEVNYLEELSFRAQRGICFRLALAV